LLFYLGKDRIIFATEDYLSEPSNAILLPDNPNEIDTSNAGTSVLLDRTHSFCFYIIYAMV